MKLNYPDNASAHTILPSIVDGGRRGKAAAVHSPARPFVVWGGKTLP